MDGQGQRIANIGKRYADAVKRTRKEIPEAEVEGTVADFYRPEIKISGSVEDIKKALNIIFDMVGIPPETEIGLRELTGIGTSRKGYKATKEVIKERGYKVKAFLHNFSIPAYFSKHPFGSGYAPIVKKKQLESKT